MFLAVAPTMADPARQRLTPRRASETFELRHGAHVYTVSVGYTGIPGVDAADAVRPLEIFLTGGRGGQQLDIDTRDAAIAVSLALQYGCPVDVIRGALLRNEDGTPAGVLAAVMDRIQPEGTAGGEQDAGAGS